MQTFGFDLDGVLYDWHRAMYRWLIHNTDLDLDEETFWLREEGKQEGCYSKSMWDNLASMPHLYEQQVPLPGVVDAVKEIAKTYKIIYITHRRKELRFVTESWLETYDFPNRDNLIFTVLPKDMLLEFHPCKYYVEDRPGVIETLSAVTIPILRRLHYNKRVWDKYPGVECVSELPELIKQLERKSK